MQSALKITFEEFSTAFQRAKPPTGWGKTIAVAYSGGVDSTCLLHFVHKYLQQHKNSPSLVAIHVDHDFRQASREDADHCRRWTEARSIPSVIRRIPWTFGPFRHLPMTERNKEETARTARYRMLFETMKQMEIDVLLMAHHLDDQIETAIMRYRRGRNVPSQEKQVTTAIGLAGMRRCRRWGMGNPPTSGMSYYGLDGMSRWISRPLLEFPKERLLATAHEEILDFVEDETNKDIDLTERNAIRAEIQKPNSNVRLLWPYNPVQPERWELGSSDSSLGETVKEYNLLRDDVDQAVDQYLARNIDVSPPGTYHIITSVEPPPSSIVRFGIILRILRYVSPAPWGSPTAEANRESERLWRIANELWPYKHRDQWLTYAARGLYTARARFSGGGNVLWIPTPCIGVPTTRKTNSIDTRRDTEKAYGWIASRQPANRSTPIYVEVTARLRARKPFTEIWDNRWNIEFGPDALDMLYARIRQEERGALDGRERFIITAEDQWYQPCIKLAKEIDGQVVISKANRNVPLVSMHGQRTSDHVKMTFIRTMDAI